MNKVMIIAEAGVNHNGDINLAKNLIDVAAEAKVDIVKFQTWVTEELMDYDTPKAAYQNQNDPESENQFQMAKKLELSFGDFKELKSYCEKMNIKFLSTPDEEKSLDFLVDELKMDLIKVGSGEVTNIPFLKKVGAKKTRVILSTGMSTIGEVEVAYETLLKSGAKSVSLLHCTSEYPAPLDQVNLKAINTLKSVFPTVIGYSDHTLGIEISLAATAMGAQIIEKHFTLDKTLPGPDHKASLDPNELKLLVQGIRNIELALSGTGEKKPTKSELETKKVVQKGVFLKRALKKGEKLIEDNLTTKRPMKGIPASSFDLILNKTVNKDLNEGIPLNFSDINF